LAIRVASSDSVESGFGGAVWRSLGVVDKDVLVEVATRSGIKTIMSPTSSIVAIDSATMGAHHLSEILEVPALTRISRLL
jgi:hypothetical protein